MNCVGREVGEAQIGACARQAGCRQGRVPRVRRSSPLWGTAPSLPTTKYPEALIYGRRVRLVSAAATGCGHCLPESAVPTSNLRQVRRFAEFGNSNLWFPNSSREPAAASGCRHGRPAASGSGHCPPAAGCGAVSPSLPTAKHPKALIYGRGMRVAGASTASRLSLELTDRSAMR